MDYPLVGGTRVYRSVLYMGMSYINIYCNDVNGEKYYMSLSTEDTIKDVKTIINKTCLVVDAWGYGDYSDMYDYRVAEYMNDPSSDIGFAGVFYQNRLIVSEEPLYDEISMEDLDKFLLEGLDYDPDTDPFDITELLPTMGADKLEF